MVKLPDHDLERLLRDMKRRLTELRDIFLYNMSIRNITVDNILLLEQDMQENKRITEQLRHKIFIGEFLHSPQALIVNLQGVIDNLLLVTDILGKEPRLTTKERATVYDLLRECASYLEDACDQFKM